MSTPPNRDRLMDYPISGVLLAAARALDPAADLRTMRDLDEWATQSISLNLPCGSNYHRVHVNMLTFDIHADTTDMDEETSTAHFLWALSSEGSPSCELAGEVLSNWAGPRPPDRFTQDNADIIVLQSLRTVVRAVEYLDAGINPRTYTAFVEMGLRPSTVVDLRRLARRHGKSLDDYEAFLLAPIHANSVPSHPSRSPANLQVDTVGEEMVSRLTERLKDQSKHEESRTKRRQDERARAKKNRQTPTRRGGRFPRPGPTLPSWATDPTA